MGRATLMRRVSSRDQGPGIIASIPDLLENLQPFRWLIVCIINS
jgi:hypothetical protein